MSIEVIPPSDGRITISLDWDDAEVLCRALGMVNTGSMRMVAPNLIPVMDMLLQQFGRNIPDEARKYLARAGSQVHIYDIRKDDDE